MCVCQAYKEAESVIATIQHTKRVTHAKSLVRYVISAVDNATYERVRILSNLSSNAKYATSLVRYVISAVDSATYE